MAKTPTFTAALLVLVSAWLAGQAAGADLNAYYRFPVSVGVEYQSLTPLVAYNTPYTIMDVGVDLRLPLAKLPVLQPFARMGLLRFDSIDAAFPYKWDHVHFYGAAGIAWADRFAKNFEAGADVSIGISESYFPDVTPSGPVGQPNLLLAAGGRIGLNPSYSVVVDFHPMVRWLKSLGPLDTFDGPLVSLGVSLGYRFGEDPDSARALIRALKLDGVTLGPAFSAMRGTYARSPLGKVVVTNAERLPVTDVQVAFYQAGYMDSPTVSWTGATLKPGESVNVDLKAVFNARVLEGEGVTPLTGEIVATYRYGGRAVEQRQPVTYDLYDKTAITWDDDRKVAAFITSTDAGLRDWAAIVGEQVKDLALPSLNHELQVALQLYETLGATGITYTEDPSSPFTRQQASGAVDTVNFPRVTLRTRYGDCDDLTVLYASLLESRGVRTGFITVPGHIFPVFDTGVEPPQFGDLHPDRAMTIVEGGTLWIPVEVTLLGDRADFLAAWKRAVELWQADAAGRRFYKTQEAWAAYAPTPLAASIVPPAPPAAAAVTGAYLAGRERIAAEFVKVVEAEAAKSRAKRDYNRLGITNARFGRYREAEAAFRTALQRDPAYLSARLNLANLLFLQRQYPAAIDAYLATLKVATERPATPEITALVLVNLSKSYSAAGKPQEAQAYLARARETDPSRAGDFDGLAAGAAGDAGRGASATARVLFADGE